MKTPETHTKAGAQDAGKHGNTTKESVASQPTDAAKAAEPKESHARDSEVAKIAQNITDLATATQQPSAPGETGAPVPENVGLPSFGEQGAQQHTLNAQAGVTGSIDVPGAVGTTAEPTPPTAGGATNPAIAGPLTSGARQSAPTAVEPKHVGDDFPTQGSEQPAPELAASKATYEADFAVGDRVSVAAGNSQQEGTVKGATFGEDKEVVSYKVALDGKKFNPMDPAHHGNSGLDHDEFAADQVRKA